MFLENPNPKLTLYIGVALPGTFRPVDHEKINFFYAGYGLDFSFYLFYPLCTILVLLEIVSLFVCFCMFR